MEVVGTVKLAHRGDRMCEPDDTLTGSGEVMGIESTGAGIRKKVDLTCTRQTGSGALVARATFVADA